MTKRRYKIGDDREQLSLLPPSIEDYVHSKNPVRAIDAYVKTLDLAELEFLYASAASNVGQPPYDPADLLKLYLYGYINQVRSSRRLERETQRNLELIWLINGLKPSYKTIADFRKDNADAIKAVNKDFVLLCRELELLGGKQIAIDGSFFHGNASKASITTAKALDKQLKELEEKITNYQSELEKNDSVDEMSEQKSLHKDEELKEKLEALKARQREKQTQKEMLEKSGEGQLSTTDKDARLLNKGDGTIAGYNVQSVVDDKHKLIVASDVTNDGNDQNQLYRMAEMAKEALGIDEVDALADGGYFDTNQLKKCEDTGITAYVPVPDKSSRVRAEGRFTRDAFTYDARRNIYKCPQGEELRPRGKPTEENGKVRTGYTSRASLCGVCPLKSKCLAKETKIRQIYRYEHEDVVERHRERMTDAVGKMRERSAIVEHPFGTLKCRAGWTHFLVRGFRKVGGEWSLMATCYNFGRVLNIIGFDTFMSYCAQRR